MKTVLIFSFSLWTLLTNVHAQVENPSAIRPGQLTLVYPIGSQGIRSYQDRYAFSCNAVFGYTGGLQGLEVGGVANLDKGDVSGCQLGGVANINTGKTRGLMVSGVFNFSREELNGGMLAGIVNAAHQGGTGCQVGTLNLASDDFHGIQIGVINVARRMKGVQLGIINISTESNQGVPAGLVSIIRHGYRVLELAASETGVTSLAFKLGIQRLYSIYKAGYSTYHHHPVMSYGFGLGTKIPVSDNQAVHVELTTSDLVYRGRWNHRLNLLTQAAVKYALDLDRHASFIAGPVIDFYTTRETDEGYCGTWRIPYALFRHEGIKSLSWLWVGFEAGIQVSL